MHNSEWNLPAGNNIYLVGLNWCMVDLAFTILISPL